MEKEICPECGGTGIDLSDDTSDCWYCEGEGETELSETNLCRLMWNQ